MQLRRRSARALVLAAASATLTAGALVATAAPASAAGTPVGQIGCSSARSVTADNGATACWSADNRTLWVCDTAADGHHPGVWYSLDFGTGRNRQYTSLGNGYCAGIGISGHHVLRFWAANYEGSRALPGAGTTRQVDI